MFLRITAGSLKGRRIALADDAIRPTEEKVRAALFNTLYAMRELDGAFFADLFAGSGAIGFEALSRGAEQILFVEHDRKRARHITEQAASLGMASATTVHCADSFSQTLRSLFPSPADIVFIDPPYEDRDRVPPLVRRCLEEGFVRPDGIVVTETDVPMSEEVTGWAMKEKKYGGTYLSFFIKR